MARIAPITVHDPRGGTWRVSARQRRVSPALAERLGHDVAFADDTTANATGCLLAVLVSPWLLFVPWLLRRPRVWILNAVGPRGVAAHWATADRTRGAARQSVDGLAQHLATGRSLTEFVAGADGTG